MQISLSLSLKHVCHTRCMLIRENSVVRVLVFRHHIVHVLRVHDPLF